MKVISFALALLAAIGIVIQPVAPAYAATLDEIVLNAKTSKQDLRQRQPVVASNTLDEIVLNAQTSPDLREKLADHATRGEVAILSRAQMDELAQTHPALQAKLMYAYRTMSIPNLTADEKKLIDQLTAGNLAAFKAGDTSSSSSSQCCYGGGGSFPWFPIILLMIFFFFVLLFGPFLGLVPPWSR